MTIRILICAALLGFACVGDAFAAEVTTECPLVKPGQPEIPLKYGEPYPGGIPLAGGADEFVEKDGLLYAKYNYNPTSPFLNSLILCQYADESKIEISVPGGLLHCGMTIREISRTPPIRKEWLRVWCISDVK